MTEEDDLNLIYLFSLVCMASENLFKENERDDQPLNSDI